MDKSRTDTDRYDNLHEITAPPPVENPQASAQSASRHSSGTTHGTLDEYANLDELAAPSPVENPQEKHLYSHHNLEESRREQEEDKDTTGPSHTSTQLSHEYRGSSSQVQSLNELTRSHDSNHQSIYQHQGLEEIRSADWETERREEEDQEKASYTVSSGSTQSSPDRHSSSKIITHLYVTSYLIFFSILGTLARLGLQALTTYPGAPVAISELWANVGGCFIMGYLSEERMLFRHEWEISVKTARGNNKTGNVGGSHGNDSDRSGSSGSGDTQNEAILSAAKAAHKKAKKTIPVYIGLAVGFCGSLTSFSSFMRDIFLALSNNINVCSFTNDSTGPCTEGSRNAGNSVMAVLAVLLVEICLCLSALIFGAHMAIGLDPLVSKIPALKTRRVLDPIMVVLAVGSWIGAVFMAIWPPDRPFGSVVGEGSTWAQEAWRGKALFAIVFAPLGCLARFHASLRLNGLLSKFPVGTFVVNIAGSMVLGMCWDLQRTPLENGTPGGGLVGCQVLQGVQDGFCGCLTTVSTWVVELQGLRRKHAYVYGMMSVGIGLSSLVVIMGSLVWRQGTSQSVCSA